jgi:hypothetical protein
MDPWVLKKTEVDAPEAVGRSVIWSYTVLLSIKTPEVSSTN